MTTVTIQQGSKTKELEAATLTGTEKQIAWAEDIRRNFFLDFAGYAFAAWKTYKATKTPQEFQAICTKTQDFFLTQSGASFWIDMKQDTLLTVDHINAAIAKFAQ